MERTEADLAWDEIRREVMYRINLAAANWRMRKMNEVLPELQEQFEDALNRGQILSLEPGSMGELTEAAFAEAQL